MSDRPAVRPPCTPPEILLAEQLEDLAEHYGERGNEYHVWWAVEGNTAAWGDLYDLSDQTWPACVCWLRDVSGVWPVRTDRHGVAVIALSDWRHHMALLEGERPADRRRWKWVTL